MQYEEKEDRKILKAREAHVVEARSVPDFYLCLSNGATLEFNGTVIHAVGLRKNAVRRPLTALPHMASHPDAWLGRGMATAPGRRPRAHLPTAIEAHAGQHPRGVGAWRAMLSNVSA